jgi:hypothetical protein
LGFSAVFLAAVLHPVMELLQATESAAVADLLPETERLQATG